MHVIWSIGFRPFFFFGALASILLILYWAISFFLGNMSSGYFDSVLWHAHEMLFGFGVAIVAGFLLTASANWTQTKPRSGPVLKLLLGLWLLGRLVMIFSLQNIPLSLRVLISLIDLSFLPALMLTLAPPLLIAKQWRNIQFIPILLFLTIANLLMHLSALEFIAYEYAIRSVYLSVNLILVIMVLIGGRIIPFFTQSALPHARPQRYQVLEIGSLLSVWLFIIMDFISQISEYSKWAALLAGIVNFLRWAGWKPWQTWRTPLLWILHAGYFWIALGFILIFLSDHLALLPRSVAVHAFTAGAMGAFIIGMMSRVSLGHSGRALKLAHGFIVAYLCILFASMVRVISGFFPEQYSMGILFSGMCWVAGFCLYLAYYAKILLSPRADGRPG